jgi:dipeptide/tripeptide permease
MPTSSNPYAASSLPEGEVNMWHPVAFWFFFWGEFAERSSFYGMRAILPLYLTAALALPATTAGPIYYWFKMASYLLPLLGGYLADRWFGRYWTIVGFSIPYVLGHFILGIENVTALAIALALLAGGSGVIKPNISTLMGQTYDEQRPGQEQLRSAAFLWFYFAINFGALISTLALPYLRDHYGYAIAFQFPAWLMMASLIVFAAGKRHYASERVVATPLTPAERQQYWQTLWQLLGIFGLMVFFWVAYEHNDSIWVFFARDYVDLRVPGLSRSLAPDQLQFLNPLCVLLFAPFFGWLFRKIDPQAHFWTAPRKILLGFVFGTIAIGLMCAAGFLSRETAAKVSIFWMVAAYVLLTIGEVLVYGTGLELAYAAAPKNLKGFVTACFLLTITLANFVNTGLSQLYGGSLTDPVDQRGPLSPGEFFGLSTLIVAVATVAFYFVQRQMEKAGRGTQSDLVGD